jgi:hypothetical protein
MLTIGSTPDGEGSFCADEIPWINGTAITPINEAMAGLLRITLPVEAK